MFINKYMIKWQCFVFVVFELNTNKKMPTIGVEPTTY